MGSTGTRPLDNWVSPFPGPVPYGEHNRQFFFGRDRECEEVHNRLRAYRLRLLTAPSGIGKTSFLRSKLVPRLRAERGIAVATSSPDKAPAVLVVRDWNRGEDSHKVLSDAIHLSICQLPEIAKAYSDEPDTQRAIHKDHRKLSRVPVADNALHYVADLCRAAGKLCLVLDQFEETLQGPPLQIRGIQGICAEIHRLERSWLLISLRWEFKGSFNWLEQVLGGLASRTTELEELPRSTLEEGIHRAMELAGGSIEEEVVARLLRRAPEPELEQPSEDTLLDEAPPGVSLLALNAVLCELARRAYAKSPRGPLEITADLLDDFSDEDRQGRSGNRLARLALRSYIDHAILPLPDCVSSISGLPVDMPGAAYEVLERRRAIARMAPHFSSSGLKMPVRGSILAIRAWTTAWESLLGLPSERLEQCIEETAGIDDVIPAIERELGELSTQPLKPQGGVLSGRLRLNRRSSTRSTARHLVKVAKDAINLLHDKQVLRLKPGAGEDFWEVVHDGLGTALYEWSIQARADPRDSLVSPTARRGRTFRWKRLDGRVEGISWLGCVVMPERSLDQLVIERTEFIACDLKGTIFSDCLFRGASFERCDLNGAVFRDCRFEASAEGEPVRFRGKGEGASSPAFLGGTVSHVVFDDYVLNGLTLSSLRLADVAFENCIINQMTAARTQVSAPVEFRNCWIMLSDLADLAPFADAVHFRDGCRVKNCRLGADKEQEERMLSAIRRDPSNDPEAAGWPDSG
jgi:uncharacterized protein YjbI with pentapeptide repeats